MYHLANTTTIIHTTTIQTKQKFEFVLVPIVRKIKEYFVKQLYMKQTTKTAKKMYRGNEFPIP